MNKTGVQSLLTGPFYYKETLREVGKDKNDGKEVIKTSETGRKYVRDHK